MESLNTEGITFKKPSQNNKISRSGTSGKRKLDDPNSSKFVSDDINLDILRTFEEPSKTIPRRIELYNKNLELLKKNFKNSQEKCNAELREKLDTFVQSSFQLVEKDSNVLPIGVLESGLSVGENSSLFDFIEEKIRNSTEASGQKVYLCRVQSGTSPSTKAVFQRICRQIVNEQTAVDDDENASENPIGKKERHFSLYDVKSFLPINKSTYKILILLEDVDYFSNTIVSQVLTLMGCSKLPVVFIFGASHGHFISNLIPTQCSANFVVDRFYSISAKTRLNEFMRRVLFDCNNPFRVSGSVVSYLESQYKEDNFSLEYIFNAVKFCLRSHFLTAKSTFCDLENSFCDDTEYPELDKWFDELSQESQSTGDTPNKRQKTKPTLVETKDLASCINEIGSRYFTLRFLCFLNFRLPDEPLGDTYTRIYISCYEGYGSSSENDENGPFHRFMRALNNLSKSDVKDLLEDCCDFITKNNQAESEIGSFVLTKSEKLLQEIEEDKKPANMDSIEDIKEKRFRLKKRTQSIKELQQTLMEMKRQNEGTTLIHNIKTDLADFIRNLLKQYLPLISSLQFSDIFIFKDLNHVITTLFPANFLQLSEDLVNPGYFLQCSCCSSVDSFSICDSLPDVSIIHKLISEHTTKKVDLNIIYHTYVSIVQTTGKRGGKAATLKDTATASYLIRFRRAVGELQHMGFIKRSKSKPDEISRLTWW